MIPFLTLVILGLIFVRLKPLWRLRNVAKSRQLHIIGRRIADMNKTLERIEALLKPAQSVPAIEFYTIIGGQRKKVVHVFLKVSDKLPMLIEIKDKFGNAAQVDGVPQWAVTDASLAELEVAADGMTAMVKPLGTVGVFDVQVTADADLGEGVKTILGVLPVELLPGEAVSVNIAALAPVPQE